MDEIIYLLKTAGPKMVPFVKAVAIYFLLVTFEAKGVIWTTLIKCAPIICLMFFVLLYGFSFTKKHNYSQRILCGLLFSCAGDALLNLNLFPHGMGAFAIAQGFYILAFGFRPLKLWIGIALYAVGITFVGLIFQSLDKILIVGLPVYTVLLTTMCWRSLARANYHSNFLNILCAIGSVLFVISDGLIAIDRFYLTIPHSKTYIMITYYAAQFAITLSIANDQNSTNTKESAMLNESSSNNNVPSKSTKTLIADDANARDADDRQERKFK